MVEPVIGGVFGLPARPDPAAEVPWFLGDHAYVSARAALAHIIETVAPRRVWLPGFACAAMVDAIWFAGAEFSTYPSAFSATSDDRWLHDLGADDLVIVVDDFGAPGGRHLVDAVATAGAWLVEDACPALLSRFDDDRADFVIRSPRKFIGVPDGGIVLCQSERSGVLPGPADQADVSTTAWVDQCISFMSARASFDSGQTTSRDWVRAFQLADATAPLAAHPMSATTRDLLTSGFAYTAIAETRRRNYTTLADGLGMTSVLGPLDTLGADVVPQVFPIRVERRDQIKAALFGHEIYPPGPWGRDDRIDTSGEWGYDDLLLLPIDQRYGDDAMGRIIDALTPLLP